MSAIFKGFSFPHILIAFIIVSLLILVFSAPKPLFPTFATRNNEGNSLNHVSASGLVVRPKLNQLIFHIQEFSVPTNSIPLYPLYDKSRNVIWVGDTAIDSGTTKYTEHKVRGTSIVTVMALDAKDNQLWYVDPLIKRLGNYNPSANTTKLYNIPTQGTIARIAIDLDDNLWLTSPNTNEILRFNTKADNFTVLHLPTINATPIGIALDKRSGQIWIAEATGKKLANIDPTKNYKIHEYYPSAGMNIILQQ
ncbi:MAG: hypothetical protein WA667_26265 [Candidatus Nitrosopolaris sp.]